MRLRNTKSYSFFPITNTCSILKTLENITFKRVTSKAVFRSTMAYWFTTLFQCPVAFLEDRVVKTERRMELGVHVCLSFHQADIPTQIWKMEGGCVYTSTFAVRHSPADISFSAAELTEISVPVPWLSGYTILLVWISAEFI